MEANAEQPDLLVEAVEGSCLLSPAAQAELDMAMMLQRHGDAEQERQDDCTSRRSSRSGRSAAVLDPSAAPRGSRDGPPHTGPAEAESVPSFDSLFMGLQLDKILEIRN